MDTFAGSPPPFSWRATLRRRRGGGGGGGGGKPGRITQEEEEEEEEEEDIFVFNDTIEGPRAPAVKPGRVLVQKKNFEKGKRKRS